MVQDRHDPLMKGQLPRMTAAPFTATTNGTRRRFANRILSVGHQGEAQPCPLGGYHLARLVRSCCTSSVPSGDSRGGSVARTWLGRPRLVAVGKLSRHQTPNCGRAVAAVPPRSAHCCKRTDSAFGSGVERHVSCPEVFGSTTTSERRRRSQDWSPPSLGCRPGGRTGRTEAAWRGSSVAGHGGSLLGKRIRCFIVLGLDRAVVTRVGPWP